MKIDIKSKDCIYITINNHTFGLKLQLMEKVLYLNYIDDSTNEQIFEKWIENKNK